MELFLYLVPFSIALAFSLGISLLLVLMPLFRGRVWRTGARHTGRSQVSRLGGLALVGGFLAATFLDPHLVITRELWALLGGAVIILVFGLWDDFRPQHWHTQLFFQVSLAVAMFLAGIRILSLTLPGGYAWFFTGPEMLLPSFVIFSIWLILVMNALNWLDGLDGLAGGVGALSLLTICLLALKPEVNQPPIAILALAGTGASLGFLFFNFAPARLLAGTTGALFLGFLIAMLSVIAGTKIATALLVLSLPIADALWVIGDRLWHRRSLFEADGTHLHYRLRRLGWSEKRIAWFFYGVTALISIVALSTSLIGKLVAILTTFALLFTILFAVAWKTRQLHRAASSGE